MGVWRDSLCRIPDSFLPRSEWLDHVEVASTGFMVASDGVISAGYENKGPGVCLGVGETYAEGVPSQGGRGDAQIRRKRRYFIYRTCGQAGVDV